MAIKKMAVVNCGDICYNCLAPRKEDPSHFSLVLFLVRLVLLKDGRPESSKSPDETPSTFLSSTVDYTQIHINTQESYIRHTHTHTSII